MLERSLFRELHRQHHQSLKPVPPGQTPIRREDLVDAIITGRLPVRFQLQRRKINWVPGEGGV